VDFGMSIGSGFYSTTLFKLLSLPRLLRAFGKK
jgi:hypothetical protein